MLSFKEYLEQFTDTDEIDELASSLAEQTIRNIKRYGHLQNIDEANTDTNDTGKVKDTEQKLEIARIINTYYICSTYIGPNRLKQMMNVINQRRNQLVFAGNNGDVDQQQARKAFVTIYRLLLRKLKEKDPTGRTNVKLRYTGNRFVLTEQIDEGLLDTIKKMGSAVTTKVFQIGKTYATKVLRFFKRKLSGKFDLNVIDLLWNFDTETIDAKMSDDDKIKAGVTWAQTITIADINRMNKNEKVDMGTNNAEETEGTEETTEDKSIKVKKFLVTVITVASQYGVKANEAVFRAIADMANDGR